MELLHVFRNQWQRLPSETSPITRQGEVDSATSVMSDVVLGQLYPLQTVGRGLV